MLPRGAACRVLARYDQVRLMASGIAVPIVHDYDLGHCKVNGAPYMLLVSRPDVSPSCSRTSRFSSLDFKKLAPNDPKIATIILNTTRSCYLCPSSNFSDMWVRFTDFTVT